MSVAPYMLGRRGPGRAVIANDPGGGGVIDGGFVDQPVVTTTASGNTTINGKTKPGAFGKMVYPLATIAAGRQYTFRYTPHFSQLAQQGKLAMVGFGLKNNNDFHIFGLRGDGSTGLHKYEVYGTPPNGWNKDTGHTVNDGGAAASGSQAGPNYIRLIVSADGTTVTLKSSTDGSTWNTEFSGAAITPFSNVSGVVTFGLALWFNNADAGPFSIDIDQFADAAAPPVSMAAVSTATALEQAGSTITGANMSFGATAANRLLYISVAYDHFSNTRTLDTVTVGGASATRLIRAQGGAAVRNAEIWVVDAGEGSSIANATSGNVVLTFNSNGLAGTITVYRATDASQTPSSTATGSNSATITIPPGGAALFAFCNNGSGTGSLSNITEDYNSNSSTDMRGIHGSKASTPGESVTSTFSGTASGSQMAAVAIQPA